MIQELALARHVLFYSNGHSFRWLAVAVGYMALQSGILQDMKGKGTVSRDARSDPGNVNSFSNARNAYHNSTSNSKPTSLSNLWYECWNANATDPRDYVYGLLGFGYKSSIVPDYSKSEVQVFADAVAFCIEQDRNFNVLSLAGVGLPRYRRPGTPSWVPNLPVVYRSELYAFETPVRFSAGGVKEDSALNRLFQFDNARLVLGGFIVDEIVEATNVFTGMDVPSNARKTLATWVNDALSLAYNSRVFDLFAEDSCNRFARTLTARLTYRRKDEEARSGVMNTSEVDPRLAFASLQRIYLDEAGIEPTEPVLSSRARILEDTTFDMDVRKYTASYIRFIDYFARHRRFATTKNGDLALLPAFAEPGDAVCVLPSAIVPLIVREVEGRVSEYQLVGEAYVDGLMQGERLRMGEMQETVLV